jgi:hypothetical protein
VPRHADPLVLRDLDQRSIAGQIAAGHRLTTGPRNCQSSRNRADQLKITRVLPVPKPAHENRCRVRPPPRGDVCRYSTVPSVAATARRIRRVRRVPSLPSSLDQRRCGLWPPVRNDERSTDSGVLAFTSRARSSRASGKHRTRRNAIRPLPE